MLTSILSEETDLEKLNGQEHIACHQRRTRQLTPPQLRTINVYRVLSTEQGTQDINLKMWLLPFTQSSEGTIELRHTYKCSINTDEGRNMKSSRKTENEGWNQKLNESRSC